MTLPRLGRKNALKSSKLSRKQNRSGRLVHCPVAAVLSMILASDVALATPGSTELPTGGTVVGGSATIASSGARLDINQTSGRAAIDWNTFNIGSDAHVHFQQPAGGVALNRVLASDASQIYGRLTSTGQVFLLNPQGIYFAPGAQVDVGGLVASTLNLSNANFMAGNYAFQGGSSNAIINQGNITAASGGTLALIAAKITNDGTLTAPGGNVLLGAGSKVTLDMGGPVKLQIENSALETLIANGGAIRAEGGTIGSPRKRPPPWPAA
jgi:filamentous hemagglutinin family protein